MGSGVSRHTINNQRHDGSNILFHLGLLFTVSVWGTSFVSTRILLDNGLGPVSIYICRFTLAYILLFLIDHRQLISHSWKDELLLALCGITSGSIYFIAENTALEYTPAANVSLITSLAPLLTTLLIGIIYRNEKPTVGTWVGSIIAFLGVGFVIFNNGAQEGGGSIKINFIGDFLSLAAAFSWAVYSILLRRVSANYSTTFITRKTLFYGVITSLPFLGIESGVPDPHVFCRLDVWGNILFLGVGASLICFFLWSVSVKRLGAITASNYLYFQPIVTLIIAWIILNERITVMGYLGCILIIGGLILGDYLSNYKRRSHTRH